jgi:hypothetical protein
MGPKYLKLCDGLDMNPAANLTPVIQFALYVPVLRLGAGANKRLQMDSDAVMRGDDDEGPHFGASLVPEDLALEVICNDTVATLYPASCRVHVNGKDMTATQFEQYAGAGSAKKWKTSLRILPGQVPECPQGMELCRMHARALECCPLSPQPFSGHFVHKSPPFVVMWQTICIAAM